ncbi:MAG: adenine phosphoribosyltransferase [Bacteroidota bacterium]
MDLQTRIKSAIRDIPDFPKPGILFKDITPVLADAALCKDIINGFADQLGTKKIDGIVGIESRGFLFGMMLAQKFNVPFLPVRKKGKLPFKTYSYEYTLEYGSATMEMHIDSVAKGSSILIHDDLLATGGTAAAAAELVKMQGGHVSAFSFLIGLDFLNGKDKLIPHSDTIISLVNF